MPQYKHKDGETVHTVPGSVNDQQLAVKAKDAGSGWTLVPAEAASSTASRGRRAPAATEENTSG